MPETGFYLLEDMVIYNLDERLQRVKPLCYPPANRIGEIIFYWSSEHH